MFCSFVMMGHLMALQSRRRRRDKKRAIMKMRPKNDYISQLPTEILEKILIHLDGKQLTNFRIICRRWREVISQSDFLWQEISIREMGIVAVKAKEGSSPNMLWYHIYRNLKLWPQLNNFKTQFNLFFMVSANPSNVTTGDLNQGILVINGNNYSKLMDVKRNSYKLLIINGTQICERIVSKGNVTALQLKENKSAASCLYIERTVQAENMEQEAVFKDVKLFTFQEDKLHFCTIRNEIYKVDLQANRMTETLCLTSTYNIMELFITHTNSVCLIKVFTECGYIVTYLGSNVIDTQFLHSWSWGFLHTRYSVVDENNYISYLLKMMRLNVPTKHCIHYGFPPISIAVLYNNVVIFATTNNKILGFDVMKMHMEINDSSFIVLGSIKKSEVIEKICISETSKGPVIMVATKGRIYLCKLILFPMEKDFSSPFDDEAMYGRLTRLRDRLEEKSKMTRQVNKRKRKLIGNN